MNWSQWDRSKNAIVSLSNICMIYMLCYFDLNFSINQSLQVDLWKGVQECSGIATSPGGVSTQSWKGEKLCIYQLSSSFRWLSSSLQRYTFILFWNSVYYYVLGFDSVTVPVVWLISMRSVQKQVPPYSQMKKIFFRYFSKQAWENGKDGKACSNLRMHNTDDFCLNSKI